MSTNKRLTPLRSNSAGNITCAGGTFRTPKTMTPHHRAGSSSNLNQTTAPGIPKFKSSAVPEVNEDLAFSLVYNDYLVALGKSIVSEQAIEQKEQDLRDQLAIERDSLHKLHETHKQVSTEVNRLNEVLKVGETIKCLQSTVEAFKDICTSSNPRRNVEEVIEVVLAALDKLRVKNIKPITTQAEYEQLMQVIESVCRSARKILNSGREIEGTIKLGECLKQFETLKKEIVSSQKSLNRLQNDSVYSLVQNASDMFAVKYEK